MTLTHITHLDGLGGLCQTSLDGLEFGITYILHKTGGIKVSKCDQQKTKEKNVYLKSVHVPQNKVTQKVHMY